jgi:DNA-binding MarR family transcriptional regulator
VPADTNSVQTLLDQIHWLSAELKRRAAASPEQDKLLLAARSVLQTLSDEGDSSVPAIAHVRNTTRQNIQIIANRLTELGLVEFVPNPRHKKSDLLHMTEKGAAVLSSAATQQAAFVEDLAARLQKVEVDAALQCLAGLHASLSGTRAPTPRAHTTAPAATKRPVRSLPLQPEPVPATAPIVPETTSIPVPTPYSDEESLPVNLL